MSSKTPYQVTLEYRDNISRIYREKAQSIISDIEQNKEYDGPKVYERAGY